MAKIKIVTEQEFVIGGFTEPQETAITLALWCSAFTRWRTKWVGGERNLNAGWLASTGAWSH